MKRRALHARRAAGGFTLLELLIATAVGAIVLIVIQTAFFGALRLHNTTHAHIEADLAVQRALSIVRRDFSGLMLPGGPLSGQLQTTTFSSTMGDSFGERVSPDIFTNSGKIDGWSPFSEVQMVAYYLAPASEGGEGKNLIRATKRNLLPVQDAAGDPRVLLHGVLEAAVEFFDGTTWTDVWDSETSQSLPTALKLRLVLAPPDRTQAASAPIELIVPILVTMAAATAQAAGAAQP